MSGKSSKHEVSCSCEQCTESVFITDTNFFDLSFSGFIPIPHEETVANHKDADTAPLLLKKTFTSQYVGLDRNTLFEILQYLDAKSLARLAQTCKAFNEFCDQDPLWQYLSIKEFKLVQEVADKINASYPQHWKLRYRNQFLAQHPDHFHKKIPILTEISAPTLKLEFFHRIAQGEYEDDKTMPIKIGIFFSTTALISGICWAANVSKDSRIAFFVCLALTVCCTGLRLCKLGMSLKKVKTHEASLEFIEAKKQFNSEMEEYQKQTNQAKKEYTLAMQNFKRDLQDLLGFRATFKGYIKFDKDYKVIHNTDTVLNIVEEAEEDKSNSNVR